MGQLLETAVGIDLVTGESDWIKFKFLSEREKAVNWSDKEAQGNAHS